MQEISNTAKTVVLSSERLAAASIEELHIIRKIFSSQEITILMLTRSREKYIESTWRHLVYRHDYSHDLAYFKTLNYPYEFDMIEQRYSSMFSVKRINIEAEGWQKEVEEVIGCDLQIENHNKGIDMRLARILNQIHNDIGTNHFSELFGESMKNRLAEAYSSLDNAKIVPEMCQVVIEQVFPSVGDKFRDEVFSDLTVSKMEFAIARLKKTAEKALNLKQAGLGQETQIEKLTFRIKELLAERSILEAGD